MPEICIETARMILRTEAPGDLEIWAQHMNTEQVTDHLGGPRPLLKIEANFARNAACQAQHGFSFWIMQHKINGDVIGNCGLKRVDNEHASMQGELEIGWSLRADYWRQGYAFEAAAACLDYAFRQLDASRIFAMTADRNEPSWRMMDKLGMQRREELDFIDPEYPAKDNPTIIYSIEQSAWQ